jgi:hypothetical protein
MLGAVDAAYYYKTATAEESAASRWYGWNYFKTDTTRWTLSDIPLRYEPTAPVFESVNPDGATVEIRWSPSRDDDHDLCGYRVYVSHNSRGWQHQAFTGADEVKPYFQGGWKPEMYDAMFRVPPCDAGMFVTNKTSVRISLTDDETKYVTVMPFDRHGESVGRKLYAMTEELTIRR